MERVNRNEGVLQEVVARLKTDSIPCGAMYILPNGTVLDLFALENGHADLWAYFDERISKTTYPQYDIVNYLRDKGWIRANTKVQYIEMEQIPTEKQTRKIAEILKIYPINVKINL